MFVFFSDIAKKSTENMVSELVNYVQSNKDIISDFAKEYLEMEKLDIDEYIYETKQGNRGNKLTICLLCQLYKVRAAIIGEDEIWFTSLS